MANQKWKMLRRYMLRGVIGYAAVCSLLGAATYTFRNGANGYSGSSDASINTQYAQYNGGNGTQWSGDAQLGCYVTTGSGSYAVRYILKFGNLALPAGSQVASASLTLSVESWDANPGSITGFYLKNAWDPAAANLGWIHRSASADWASPGASSAGVDTVADKTFPLPALRQVGDQTLTIPLDPAVVQSWIDTPAANQGVMLVNNIAGQIVRPYSTVASQNLRPMLTVVTSSGAPAVSVTVSPLSANLQSGGTQQFTASVTGSSNTAVTWAATGGSVSSAGLYTAGSTAGSYSVKATSVADTTKSATASVTIQVAAPVQLTVSPTSTILQTGQTQQFTAAVTGTTNTAVTWSATGGTISATGLYTAGSATGSFTATATSVADATKSASASVTIVAPSTGGHPRIILDNPTLSVLRSRAQSNTAEWVALKSVCDSYLGGGTVNFPGQDGYPNLPSVGEGYQGSGYVDAVMPLGLCYQTLLPTNPSLASQYGTKAVAVLMAMSDPAHTTVNGAPVWDRDDGYGIRNFGFAMGIGYDWFYPLLTSAQRTQLQTSLSNWINGFEKDSFEYDHPQGNYFAGYYVSKCMAALAVQGDSTLGDTWWNDWYNNQHLARVAPYYAANLAGGGWTEGFAQYGILGSRNQTLPVLAVKTAKGIDLATGTQPYKFTNDQARYLMHFTWPTRDMTDDRGELYNTGDVNIWPGTPNLESYHYFAGLLAILGDPLAPMMHRYARDVKAALDALSAGDSPEWIDFLFWDPNAQDAPDYSSLPASYLAPGIGGVAARSDWNTTATFLSFISAPYINNPAAGHEAFDKGSLAIEKEKLPLVVNPDAWITHEPNGSAGWNVTYDDRFGNWDQDHTVGNRTLYNTFQVRHLDTTGNILDNYGQYALRRADGARTKIGRYEDGGSYVLAIGQFLEDMYRPFQTICAGVSPVTSWSRQILFLRPMQFIVYDRTGICNASLDQYLAFHFPANPVEATSPGAGVRRFDVTTSQFAGSMSIVLPANAATTTTDRLSTDSTTWSKVWRTEIRPTGTATASRPWLTVFDLASTSSQVASASPVNIVSGAAAGTLLQSASGNTAAVFGTAPVGTAISGALTYTTPAAQTRHYVTDLAPSTGYTISVSVVNGAHTVTVSPGGSTTTTANGVLSFGVTAAGVVQP